MPNYRRFYQPGGTYFFTVVTAARSRILTDPQACRLLRRCITEERHRRPFVIEAMVLLPDHLHTIWKLPPGDSDFSIRWKMIKAAFTHRWLEMGGKPSAVSVSRQREGRRGVWQPRYMEHAIRDENDFIQHVEYIHYNPVKHRYVDCPRDWQWSSFHRYVRAGYYPRNWCCTGMTPIPTWATIDERLVE